MIVAWSADLLWDRTQLACGLLLAVAVGWLVRWAVCEWSRMGEPLAEPPPVREMGQFLKRERLGVPMTDVERELDREVFG